jgi:hypothetical protein
MGEGAARVMAVALITRHPQIIRFAIGLFALHYSPAGNSAANTDDGRQGIRFKINAVILPPGTARGHVPYISKIYITSRDSPVRLSWQNYLQPVI